MKTMQEVQALIRNLREIYTDVRLLDEATVERIQEGKRTDPCGEDLCYACRHKEHISRHCAAKQALRTRTEQCRLEFFDPDIAQVIARYYEVDGKPYVLEMIKRTHGTSVLDMEDSEHFISSIPGYATKLYRDALTGVYNRRYYEETVSSLIGPAGVAVMDLDDFKIYNDTYGHHAGDLVLETVARVIRNCIRQTDTLKRKQFVKGTTQIAQEGAIQIFHEPNTGMEEVIVGVVGTLQFDVFEHRMATEYNVEIINEGLPYQYIRWIDNEGLDPKKLNLSSDTKIVQDFKGNYLLLFTSEWNIRWALEKNEGLMLSEFNKN